VIGHGLQPFRGFTAAASLKRDAAPRVEVPYVARFPRFHRRGLIEAISAEIAAWARSAALSAVSPPRPH